MDQELRNQDVRNSFEVVARPRVTFHPDAELAQRLHPAPYLLPRLSDFLRDFRAADHNRRVLDEQRQQRVNAPVGGARQICHSLCCHILDSLALMREGRSA